MRISIEARRVFHYIRVLPVAGLLVSCTTFEQPLQYPSLSLTDVRVIEAGLFEQKFSLELNVKNPNAFTLPVRGLDYTLHLGR